MILACNNINKSFLDKSILKDVTININEHEKVAIVGDNGCGKSTLLKILVDQISCDKGDIIISKGSTIGYLAQHQDIDSDKTLYDEMQKNG